MPIERHDVVIDGLTLHYQTCGEGPPVLLLHGWPTHGDLWRHVLPVLGRTHRAIALDLPGFGASAKPLDGSYGVRFQVGMIEAFLREVVGDGPVGLVVHDLGGPLGLAWAVRHPERVRRLMCLNTLVFPEMSWAVKLFMASLALPGVRRWVTSPQGIAYGMRLGLGRRRGAWREVAERYVAPMRTPEAREALRRTASHVSLRAIRETAAGLPRLTCEVGLLYGDADWILPDVATTMARMAEIFPGATVTALRGAGHFLQEDAPAEVADAVAAFFAAEG